MSIIDCHSLQQSYEWVFMKYVLNKSVNHSNKAYISDDLE